MPAYNFKPQFVAAIRDGDKTQTIRRPRRRPTVKGDRLTLYTGMRQKGCRLILHTTCTGVRSVMIAEEGLTLAGKRQSAPAADRFAHADGFTSYFEMRAFFRKQYGLPFNGEVVSWNPRP